jgi:hypothetical protein
MSTAEDHGTEANRIETVDNLDLKLEVIFIPVSDVDRSKEFYGSLGWRLGWQRLASPGSHHAAARSHRPRHDRVCIGERSGERAPPGGRGPRRA